MSSHLFLSSTVVKDLLKPLALEDDQPSRLSSAHSGINEMPFLKNTCEDSEAKYRAEK